MAKFTSSRDEFNISSFVSQSFPSQPIRPKAGLTGGKGAAANTKLKYKISPCRNGGLMIFRTYEEKLALKFRRGPSTYKISFRTPKLRRSPKVALEDKFRRRPRFMPRKHLVSCPAREAWNEKCDCCLTPRVSVDRVSGVVL